MGRLRSSFLNPAVLASDRLTLARIRFPRFKPGLRIKLLVVVVAISLIGILASSLLLLSLLREQFIDNAEASLVRSNQRIQASLDHAMLTHDSAMVNTIVQRIASDLDGERIRILDPNGIVRHSSSTAEVGMRIERSAPECQACHIDGAAPAVTAQTIRHSNETGAQELLSVSLITNEPQCTGCHAEEVKTLGILMINAPLTDLDNQTQEGVWRVGIAALVTFALLVGLMVPALRKFITAPIGELSRGVSALGAENLEYRVRVSSRDELGQLAEAFNAMQQQLNRSRQEMKQRNQELSLLYEVALVTGQLLEMKQILKHALDTVVDRLGLELGHIYLWDSDKNRFESAASRGLSSQQLQLIDQKRHELGGDLTLEVALTGEVYFDPDVSKNQAFVSQHGAGLWENLHQRSYVNVPLKSQGKVVGTLELLGHAEQPLTERQVEILKVVGHQIGIAIDNTSLLAETQRNAREALTLYQLGAAVSSSLDLDQVLDAVAKGAREALASDIAIVGLLDAEHQQLVFKAIAGARSAAWHGLRIPVEHLRVFVSAQPLSLEERPSDLSEPLTHLWDAEQIASVLAVPLLRGEHPHGSVAVLSRTRRVFAEEEVRLLARLAQQVVVAIENARLYQQVRHLAVLEERDRLAREMHDDLAQALGFLNLKASLTTDLLARGDTEQAQASLLEMKQITREAYTDTREAIFNLRNAVSLGADLVSTLREYLAEYRAHYGLDAQLVVEDALPTGFPADVAAQLGRIIQEALANIRKHAQATRVWVRFEREANQARIVIQDNGRGFDLTAAQAEGEEHIGLQIMRERAESVGGTVELESQIGHGTCVVVRVPIPPGA